MGASVGGEMNYVISKPFFMDYKTFSSKLVDMGVELENLHYWGLSFPGFQRLYTISEFDLDQQKISEIRKFARID
ncbi:MAG: hypothetical protein ABIF08_03210 [Nanoarchaeota archaeon]